MKAKTNEIVNLANYELIQKQIEDEPWQEVRERTAIAAIQGLSANPNLVYDDGEEKIDIVARAMRYADELLEKLKGE